MRIITINERESDEINRINFEFVELTLFTCFSAICVNYSSFRRKPASYSMKRRNRVFLRW